MENVMKNSQIERGIKIKLKGLDCPNCAGKIEGDTSKLEGVLVASVNLMKQELTIDINESSSKKKVYKNIEAIVKKYEPDVEVSIIDKDSSDDGEEEEFNIKNRIILYGIGILFFVAALLPQVSQSVKTVMLMISYLIFGLGVLKTAARNILKGQVFDENFLMSISTIGAIAIGEMPEAVFVMLFYQIGETFQSLAVHRSRKSIKELMNIRPDFANVETSSGVKTLEPADVKIGNIIVVKAGEKIPLDGIIVEGYAQLDTSALTGESVPRNAHVGDEALSGSINLTGLLKIKVTREFGDSTVVKILELVENATSKKSKTEQFITKFAKVYTPVVVFAALALAFIPPVFTVEADIKMWIGRALIFLVISCPCALVLSVPLGFFSGIGEASRRGVLIKGSNYMQALNEVETVVFDKTGTLTKGVFEVSEIKEENNFSKDKLLQITAFVEKMSNHPIAKSISNLYENKNGAINEDSISKYEEIGGHGVKAVIDGKVVYAGNMRLMERDGIKCEKFTGIGSVVYVASDGVYAGRIIVSDKIKDDSKSAIEKLKKIGVRNVVMLTGDSRITAEKISNELGLDSFFAELLPHQKVEKLEELLKNNKSGKIVFVGDGINDAPVLARADIGIAMGGIGSDAAIEAADVVIMNDEPSKIADGIIIARSTNRIVKQNIVFALAVKAIVLGLGAFGIATMWAAVFADVGVALIAILNSMRKKI